MTLDASAPSLNGALRVSVIVPVRDNAEGIWALLRRLEAQTLCARQFEVIVADDGSRSKLIGGVVTPDGRIRVVAGPPRTSYAARNRGASAARAPVLAFCDSDCLPEPRWLEAGLAAMEDADIVAGEVTYMAPARPTVWSLLTADMFLDQARNVARSRAVTANLFVRRRDFEAWGGFDASLVSGSDFELVLRAVEQGARLAYEPRAIVYHPTLDEGRAFLRKVWRTNWWAAIRRTRTGRRVGMKSVLSLVPLFGVALMRRETLRAVGRLQHSRIRAAGLGPSWWQEVRALALLYTVVGNVSTVARLSGWLASRARGDGGVRTVSRTETPDDAHRVDGRG